MNKNNDSPIGIFDSGIGGLSVMKEVIKILPNESIIYFADKKNCPYGNKSKNEIIKLSEKIVQYLITKNCKIIILACNTATGAAIQYLRKKYFINFIGIEPATKSAAEYTKTGQIIILATEHTFQTDHFNNTKNKHAHNITVHIQTGKGLVELVESDKIETNKTFNLLRKYLIPYLKYDIDSLVLGCTHYPFLIPIIKKILPKNIKIFNPSPSVAKQTKKILEIKKLSNTLSKPKYQFVTSGKKKDLELILSKYLPFHYSIDEF